MSVLYLAEQHGKGACDRLFGWSRVWINRYIQTKPIYRINDLIACYKEGAATMRKEDPLGPTILIDAFDPGNTDRPREHASLSLPSKSPGLTASRLRPTSIQRLESKYSTMFSQTMLKGPASCLHTWRKLFRQTLWSGGVATTTSLAVGNWMGLAQEMKTRSHVALLHRKCSNQMPQWLPATVWKKECPQKPCN